MLYLLSLFLSFVAFYVWRFYENVKRYPKGPTPLPLIGNLHTFNWREAHLQLAELSKVYGDIFTIWLPKPYVCIMGYEDIKEAFKGEDVVGRTGVFPDTVFQNMVNGGIIFSDGEAWKEQRRVALHILIRDFGMGKNMMEAQVISSMEECIEHLVSLKNKDAIDLRWPIQLFVANVITKTLYGFSYRYDDCARLQRFVDTLQMVLEEIKSSKLFFLAQNFRWMTDLSIIGHMAVGRFLEYVQPMRDIVVEDIENSLKSFDPSAIPENFVHAYGGMLHMAANQQKKMRAEIEKVIGFDRMPTFNDKPFMPYCNATICELQRHANVVPINVTHRTVSETVIGGHKIPADTFIWGQIWHVLRFSPLFKDPEEFRPERFLMEDGITPNKETMEHLVPFSIGKRQCAGEALARVELFVGLLSIVQNYKIEPRPDQTINLEPQFSIVLLPKDQLIKLTAVDTH